MTATTEAPALPEESTDRLAVEAGKLRARRSLPIDRGFQLAGAVLLGVGFLAILAGWYGVSHTAREWRQTPYLVSGGILGLGFIVAGSAAYLAYWLTHLVETTNRQTAVLERLERALVGAPKDDDELVVAEPGILHRASCPLLLGKTDLRAPLKKDKNLRACPVCEPPL